MTAIFNITGEAIPYTPVSDVEAGTFVVQTNLVGITKQKIPAGKLGTIFTSGIYTGVAKATGASLSVGQTAWLDTSTLKINASQSGSRIPCGLVVSAAAAADETCSLFLFPSVSSNNNSSVSAGKAVEALDNATGVALTDSTGGTSYTNHTLKVVEDTYTKATIAGNIATLATQVEANRTDLDLVIDKVNELIGSLTASGALSAN